MIDNIYDTKLTKLINKCITYEFNLLTFVQLLAKQYKKKNPHFDVKEFYKACGAQIDS